MIKPIPMPRSRAHRIGCDLDAPTELELLTSYFNAQAIGPTDIQRTGHGFHIKVFQECESIDKNLDVRRFLGDDVARIGFDEVRRVKPELHNWIDTLFSSKTKMGKTTREENCCVLSLPFYSKFPAKKGEKIR